MEFILPICWLVSLVVSGLLLLRALLSDVELWTPRESLTFLLSAGTVLVMILYFVAALNLRSPASLQWVTLFAFVPACVLSLAWPRSAGPPATRTAKLSSLVSAILSVLAFWPPS